MHDLYIRAGIILGLGVMGYILGALVSANQLNQKKYSSLFESTQDGVWLVDHTGYFQDVNTAACNLLGYDRSELLTMHVSDIDAKEDPQDTQRRIEYIKSQGSAHFNLVLRTKTGEFREVEVTVTDLPRGNGQLIAFIRDQTERNATMQRVRESETRFRSLVESMQEFVYTLDKDHRFTGVYGNWMTKADGKREDFFGKTYRDLVGPDEAAVHESAVDRALAGEYVVFEWDLKTDDGVTYYRTSVAPLWMKGEITGIIGIGRDITVDKAKESALRRSERKFREIFHNTNDALYLHTLTENRIPGKFREVNRAACQMLGYTPEEFTTLNPSDISGQDLTEKIPTVMDILFREGQVRFEGHHITRDGDPVPVELHAVLFELEGEQRVLTVARDVTERQQAETALQKTQQYLNAAAKNLEGVLYVLDADLQFIFSKGKKLTDIGFEPDQLVGLTLFDFFQTSDPAHPLIKKHSRVLAGESLTFESAHDNISFSTSLAPLTDSQDKIVGIVGVSLDITDRKKTETQYRQLFEGAPFPYQELDSDGEILRVNRTWLELLGFSIDDVRGRWFGEFLTTKEAQQDFTTRFEHFKNTGKIAGAEWQLQHKNGQILTVVLNGRANYNDDGSFDRSHCAFRDITDQKELLAELQRFQQIMDQAGEAIVITDTSPAIKYVNPAFEQITGYDKAEVLGKNPNILQSGKHQIEFYEELWNTITSGATWNGRFINRRKGGDIYQEDAVISPVMDAEGTIINYVAVKRDVSEQIHLENQLRQSQKMDAIGRLAGGVAHDFNNLLTVIKGYANVLVESTTSTETKEMADAIAKAGEKASELTSQLLSFSRKKQIDPRVVIPDKLIQDLPSMLSRLLGEDINLQVNPGAPDTSIRIDPGQFEQIILNLAVNARDAMPQGGQLTIVTRPIPADELPDSPQFLPKKVGTTYYGLEVSDTGIGIDAEIQDQIFEPFFTTKRSGEGTGLGLATVFGVVKQSKGFITVDSTPGIGTTFQLCFPEVKEQVDSNTKIEPIYTPSLNGANILVLDDEPGIGKFVQAVLEKEGCTIKTTNSGEAAIEAIQRSSKPFDLLLTDVVLPERSGVDIAAECCALQPDLSVVFMTGYTDDRTEKYLTTKNVIMLRKPFDPGKLRTVIQKSLPGNGQAQKSS